MNVVGMIGLILSVGIIALGPLVAGFLIGGRNGILVGGAIGASPAIFGTIGALVTPDATGALPILAGLFVAGGLTGLALGWIGARIKARKEAVHG